MTQNILIFGNGWNDTQQATKEPQMRAFRFDGCTVIEPGENTDGKEITVFKSETGAVLGCLNAKASVVIMQLANCVEKSEPICDLDMATRSDKMMGRMPSGFQTAANRVGNHF